MENRQDYKVNRYLFLAVIILFSVFLFFSLIQFFTAFLAATIFYVLSKPAMEWLIKKRRWKKTSAALLMILISFFIILLPIGLLTTLLYNKVISVVENPHIIMDPLRHIDQIVQERFHTNLISDKSMEKVQAFATVVLSALLNQGLNLFSTILIMYFFLYFMLTSINRLEAGIVFFLPFPRSKIEMFGKELVKLTFSNAVGVPLICLVQGSLGYACYMIAGLPEAGFWGVITGFASIIPVLGAGVVWLPVSLYFLITGHTWQGIFVVIWGALFIGLSDNIVRFVLAKRMADVHPIVTVLGVIMGLRYFGITGLIFGPLLISYFIILLKIYYFEYQKPAPPKAEKARQLMPSYFQPFIGGKTKSVKTKRGGAAG
ncbi:AI-2E family transporter [Deminuibacter soli]|uniref:AI-2E family transporter n=1 Tax=Deminuibacter soli TaxID=2291815 RepID=A0A3E1NF24_9BACT|nr:AI-2E family transporter [Deminuibacter soli]RFM26570.1 AI-2E family transporter [Deminuibacter soli]